MGFEIKKISFNNRAEILSQRETPVYCAFFFLIIIFGNVLTCPNLNSLAVCKIKCEKGKSSKRNLIAVYIEITFILK